MISSFSSFICYITKKFFFSTMYSAIDSTNVNENSLINSKIYVAIYFVTFIVLFTFMIINIYIALIILTFQKQGQKQIQAGLDRNQVNTYYFLLNKIIFC